MATTTPPSLQAVSVDYEYSRNLPALIEELQLSIVVSTYQAGRLVSIGSAGGELQVGFSHMPQAMGLTRTPTGLAVCSHERVWSLEANREIASSINPEAGHDIAFLARSCHLTGPVMAHDLVWCNGELLLVNTLFNCVAAIGGPWSFKPRWQPPFISELSPEDRCHLNGLALNADSTAPAFATALGERNTAASWRDTKTTGGCLIDIQANRVVVQGMAMPHSPRLHRDQLLWLHSGEGTLMATDPNQLNATESPLPWQEASDTIVELPGFTRGLDCWGDLAVVGVSKIRETAVFGGLPLEQRLADRHCGIALVNLRERQLVAWLWFKSGVEEIFSVSFLPGWRNPVLIGPDADIDQRPAIWLVEPSG
jgi:uncharacterized protein (TIGR03032 family)